MIAFPMITSPESQDDGADPVPSRPGRSERVHPPGRPPERQHGQGQGGEEDGELVLREVPELTRCEGEHEAPPSRRCGPAGDQEEGERRRRIGGRLLHQDRRVGERGCHPGSGGREERPARPDDETRQPIGGEHDRGHHDRAERLDPPIGGRDVVDPPEWGTEVGAERHGPPVHHLVPQNPVPRLGDRPGERRHLELVREDRRRRVIRRLPQREPGRPGEDQEQSDDARGGSGEPCSGERPGHSAGDLGRE